MEENLDIIVQAQLDQSTDAINKLKENIGSIEEKLKGTKINLEIKLDDDVVQNLKNQFTDIQVEVEKLKNQANFSKMAESLRVTTTTAEQMGATIEKIREEANLISSRTKFDLIDGHTIQKIRTYQDNLLEVRSIIESFDEDGKTSSVIQENNINRLEAQKKLYNDLKSLTNEILTLEKQKIKATDANKGKIEQQQKALSEVANEIHNTLTKYELINPEIQKQLELTQQLKQTQIDIAKIKDSDSQSKKAYSELNKLAKEEFRVKQSMLDTDGQLLEILKERLDIVLQAKESLQSQIKDDNLYNEERHNELLRERDKLQLNLLVKEEKLAQKEAIRIEKLNDKIADVDFNETPFYDDEAIKDYVLSLQDADAEITKFGRKITEGKNRQIELTVTTQLSADKYKEMKMVIDENSKGLYKLSEAQKDASNRNLSFIKQMGIAIERSVQWAVSMHLLYGNIRKLREGIEIIKELDKELTQVSIVTGKTREETRQLAIEYAQLGKEMGKTVAEISKVNTELIRQGLSTEESYKRMQTILKLSATGGLDANQTMSIITSAVNALGQDAEKTADVMLKAGNISASSVEEIGEALTKTASSAKATDYTLEQLGATISTLVEVTQESPSSLGNSLKTLLARFNKIDEETGELNEDFNNVQTAFESVGVKFTDASGQIRPLFELLTELDTKWKDLDKNTKMYISTQSAGVRQQNRFIAIMDNFNRVQEIHNELLNAGGELNQNYSKYLDSVEASANRARASFEEMWIKGLDSDIIKDYYELMTVINQAVTKINVFKFAVAGISSIMMMSNDKIRETTRSLAEVSNKKIITWLNTIGHKIKENDRIMKMFNNTIAQSGAEAMASSRIFSFLSKVFKALKLDIIATEIAVTLLQSALTFGLSYVISSIVGGLGKLIGKSREAKREIEFLAEEVKGNVATYQDNIRALSSMKEEYESLNKKLGENRDFTKLTAEEQEKYNNIVGQLSQIAPEVVTSYDDKGNAVIGYKTKIEDLIEREKELIELEKYKLASKGDIIVKDSNKNIKKETKKLKEVEKEMSLYQYAMGEDTDYALGYIDRAKAMSVYNKSLTEQRVKLFELNAERKVLLNNIEQERNKQRDLLEVYFLEIDSLDGISKSLKETAKEKVNQKLVDEGYDKAVKEITKFQIAFEEMVKLTNSSSIDEAGANLEEVRQTLSELGFTTEEVEEIIYEFTNTVDASTEALEATSISIGVATDEYKKLAKEVEGLDGVLKKLMSGKHLSIDEFSDLIEKYDEVAQYIAETGDLSLRNGELVQEQQRKVIAQTMEQLNLDVQEKKITLETAKEKLQLAEQDLDNARKKFSVESAIYKKKEEQVKQSRESMKQLNTDYVKSISLLKAMQYSYGETFRSNEIENYASTFKEITSQLDSYTDILKEIEKYGKLSGETNRKILENHPELIHLLGNEAEMRKYLVQLIDEQKEKQQENYKQSLMATEDFSKKVLNANKSLFEELARLYKIDLDHFTTLQNFKAQMMNNSIKLLNQQGQAYVQKFGGEVEQMKAELNLAKNALSLLEGDGGYGYAYQAVSSMFEGKSKQDIEDRARQLEGAIKMAELQESLDVSFKSIDFNSKLPSKSKKKAKNKRVDKVELLTDRYIKFNKALEEVERSLQMSDKLLEYSIGKDRIKLLTKETDLLKEKQKILHLTANEERKEREELRKKLSKTINLNDGTFGADSFRKYSTQMERAINSTIAQINATSNDTLRENLTDKKDELQKAYDKVKQNFDKYIELQSSIPDLSVQWWEIEFEKFNTTLEIIDTNFEKYIKRIDNINDKLSLMIVVREDNKKEVEKEYELLKEISNIYEESLKDIEEQMKGNSDVINYYEKKIKSMGKIRNAEYKNFTRRLMMARAEQDKYFEAYQQNIIALADQQKTLIDKHTSNIEYAKNKIIKGFQDIRKEMNEFDNTSFEISIEKILADLDKIDKIFKQEAEFNLSTSEARHDLSDWKNKITGTLTDINNLQNEAKNIIKLQAKTEEDLEKKKEKLVKLIESQIGKENKLKDLEKDIRHEVEKSALEYQKIEDALEDKIRMKQDELKQLQKQFEQEDKIKRSLEKQLELMRAMDDRRYSYITGQGEEIFTYDQSRVMELQKELAKMHTDDKKDDAIKALQEEIAEMQEKLATTKEINKQELEILKLAQKSVSDILGVLNKNIEDNLGEKGLEKIFKDMSNAYIDEIKDNMKEYSEKYEKFWERIFNRIEIGTVKDSRSINKAKLGDKPSTKPTPSTNIAPAPKKTNGSNKTTQTQQNQQSKTSTYIVKPNDTLSKIAKQFNTTLDKVLQLNPNIGNPNLIFPNQKVKVPAKFDSGGFTGNWEGEEGKLAILHKKELILDENDTANVLETVDLAKSIISDIVGIETKMERPNITNNEDNKSIVLNNPIFQGIENINKFVNELNNLYRRGIPSMS